MPLGLGIGIVLVVAGLGVGLAGAHLRRLRAWDRPAWMLRGSSRRLHGLVWRAAVVSGWILIAGESRWMAAWTAAILASVWIWMGWVRSERYGSRRLLKELAALRRSEPSCGDRELLARIVLARHPEWGAELVDRIVSDHPEPRKLARMLARMERGWSAMG